MDSVGVHVHMNCSVGPTRGVETSCRGMGCDGLWVLDMKYLSDLSLKISES